MKTLIYIHGLGSNRNSRKFQNLKEYFGNTFSYDFLEWVPDMNISDSIHQMALKYAGEDVILVGDSTGANFAYQLRESIRRLGGNTVLILTSPLLDINNRIADFDFPQELIPQLWKIENPEDALIIATRTDEILNQEILLNKKLNNVKCVEVNDGHRLENFHTYLPEIKKYIIT